MPDLSWAAQAAAKRVAGDDADRLARIAKFWTAYHGTGPKPLVVKHGRPDDNLRVNLARTFIDKGVGYLFGLGGDAGLELKVNSAGDELADAADDTGPGPSAPSPADAYAAEAQQYLDGALGAGAATAQARAGRWRTRLVKLGQNGGVTGHAFLKIVTDGTGGPPRVSVLSPEYVTPEWEADDVEAVWRYTIAYQASRRTSSGAPTEVVDRRQRYERTSESSWVIVTEEKRPSSSVWAQVGDPVEWLYPFAPIADAQNLPIANEYWGMSDLDGGVLELLAGLSFSASNINRILRIFAHPRPWATGATGLDGLDTDPDRLTKLPQGAQMGLLEMQSTLEGPVTWWRELRGLVHEVARIPEVATGKLENAGSLSGRAMGILYGPLVELTDMKRLTYGELLTDVAARILIIGGFDLERLEPAITWPEVVPHDPLEERQALEADVRMGAARATALEKLGYDPDVERARAAGEAQNIGATILAGFDAGAGMDGPGAPPPDLGA